MLTSVAACGGGGPEVGDEGGDCFGNGTCQPGLVCSADFVCVANDDRADDDDADAGPAGAPDARPNGPGPDAVDAGQTPPLIPDAAPPADADPCGGSTCAVAPPPTCVGPTTRRVYDAPGTCGAGGCSFDYSDESCVGSCVAGECYDATCGAGACTSPPSNVCADAQTLREYPILGACEDDACSYEYVDSLCTLGCAGGGCAPGSWLMTPFDTDYAIWSLAVDLDSHERPRAALVDGHGDLLYAQLTPLGWDITYLDPAIGGSFSLRQVHLAIDAADGVHVVYHEPVHGNLRYAYAAAGEPFAIEFVRTGGTFRALGLSINDAGLPVAVYRDLGADRFVAVRRDAGGEWVQTRALDGFSADQADVTFAEDGAPFLAFTQPIGFDYVAHFAAPTSGSWVVETVSDGKAEDIALDASTGGAYVLVDGDPWSLHARSAVGVWSTAPLPPSLSATSSRATLESDSGGALHAVYAHPDDERELRYATNAGGTWSVIELPLGYYYYGTGAIAFDASLRPHVLLGVSLPGSFRYLRPWHD